MTTFRQVIDVGAIMQQLNNPGSGVMQELIRKTRLVQEAARIRAPHDTGRLAENIRVIGPVPTTDGIYGMKIMITTPYAKWVIEGTGIYGPHHSPIVPTTQTYMRFTSRITGRVVFRKSVAGQHPKPFIYEAVAEVFGFI